MRLFVALELPEGIRRSLAEFRDLVAHPEIWRPVPVEGLHVTLAFLGNRPEQDVAAIEVVLHAAAGPAPVLGHGGALLLPPRSPRVLCSALRDESGVLAALQARVSDGLAAAGVYTPEKRPFRPHVTVGRLRPGARPPRSVSQSFELIAFGSGPLTLFESRLHPHGARYEPLVRVNLH